MNAMAEWTLREIIRLNQLTNEKPKHSWFIRNLLISENQELVLISGFNFLSRDWLVNQLPQCAEKMNMTYFHE